VAAKGLTGSRAGSVRRVGPLLGLVALGLALGLLVLGDGPSTDEARTRARRLAPDFHAAHVHEFTVIRHGVPRRFVRRPGNEPEGGWWLDPGGRADRQAVEELLTTLEWASVERRLGPMPPPPESGLGPLEFVGGGLYLRLGKSDPLGAGIYAQIKEASKEGRPAEGQGGEVVVTDPHLAQLLSSDTSPETLRDPSLLAAPVRTAHGIEIRARRTARPIRLERHGARWDLMTPPQARSDAERVEELLKTLTDARAVRFLSAPPKELVDPAAHEVTEGATGGVTGGATEQRTGAGATSASGDARRGTVVIVDGHVRAHVLGPCDQNGNELGVLRWDGAVACFSASTLVPLFRDPRLLRELRPWPLPADEVVSLKLVQGQASLEIERGPGGDWQMRPGGGEPRPADAEAVRERLLALAALGTSGPAPPEARPSGERGAQVMARNPSGEILTLSVVGRSGGGWLVVRNTEEEPLLVGEELSPLLDATPRTFRPRRVLSLRESELRRLVIQEDRDEVVLERSGPSATARWHLVNPQGELLMARLDRLLLALGELRALGFVARSEAGSGPGPKEDGLEHPARRLRIETQGAPLELRVAQPKDGVCRALVDADTETFLLPADVCADLLAPLVTRTAPAP
jgi:hypothetical protein